MRKTLRQLLCRHTYDLYIDDDDNPSKGRTGQYSWTVYSSTYHKDQRGFGLASIKQEGESRIAITHARCLACGKIIHFAKVNYNP